MRVACSQNGHLDCLKYLHETAKAPWDIAAVSTAHTDNHPECLQYLLDNNCPLPSAIGDTRTELYTPHNKYTHKERERERKKEKHKTKLANNKI